MRYWFVHLSLMLSLVMVGLSAHAQVFHGEEMDVELISESGNAVPGETLSAAIRLDPDSNSLSAIAATAERGGSGSAVGGGQNLITIVAFALLGGLILNLMPCVFPVLSLKVLNLTSKSGASNLQYRLHGLSYTAGIVLAFMALASVLLALCAGGQAVGWAFQLQSPWFVAMLVFLFFVMGLSLSGVYEFGTRLMGVGSSLVMVVIALSVLSMPLLESGGAAALVKL